MKKNIEKSQIEEADFQPEQMKRLPRGAFLAKPGDTADLRKTKIRVTLYLDADLVAYFKERASQPNAAPYQSQINNELRRIMEQDSRSAIDYSVLLQSQAFIAAVAEKVQEYQGDKVKG